VVFLEKGCVLGVADSAPFLLDLATFGATVARYFHWQRFGKAEVFLSLLFLRLDALVSLKIANASFNPARLSVPLSKQMEQKRKIRHIHGKFAQRWVVEANRRRDAPPIITDFVPLLNLTGCCCSSRAASDIYSDVVGESHRAVCAYGWSYEPKHEGVRWANLYGMSTTSIQRKKWLRLPWWTAEMTTVSTEISHAPSNYTKKSQLVGQVNSREVWVMDSRSYITRNSFSYDLGDFKALHRFHT